MPSTSIAPAQQQAIDAIEAGESILLCGRAGTGKSFTLGHWAERTSKQHVLLAPTGVAAIHLGGQTIHAFFGIAPGALPHEVADKATTLHKSKKAIIKAMDTLVIDEISMVRADLLDCVDITLRITMQNQLPFGGKQLVLLGDMYQLPPVVQPDEQALFNKKDALGQGYEGAYFFHSQAFSTGFAPRMFNLTHSFRQQQDQEFLALLNAIRNRSINATQLQRINQHVQTGSTSDSAALCLTGTNRRATAINDKHLNTLQGEEQLFVASQWGKTDEHNLPVEASLRLKVGARVMVTRNDKPHLGRWVNGTTGTVTGFYTDTSGTEETPGVLVCKDDDHTTIKISPCSWETYRYVLRNNRVERELTGSFTQIPLRLAWALTIHKAQGKTFRQILLDLADIPFAYGQIYVALSRCTHLAGIRLTHPLQKQHILLDPSVTSFMASYQVQQARNDQSEANLEAVITQAIAEKNRLVINYLHRSDEPTQMLVQPLELTDLEHKGNTYRCLIARLLHDQQQGQIRHLNLARMLSAAMPHQQQEKA